MAREYFCAYHSYIKQCKGLSDGELGRLFRALLEYSASGKAPELNGRESVAFDFMAANIDRDAEAYKDTCNRNRENVSKRYERIRPNTTVYETYQEKEERKEELLKKDISNEISKKDSTPYEEITRLYNQICTGHPACAKLSESRKKAIRARFASGYTVADFKTLFQKTKDSSFLNGGNDRNWIASFDWLIKDSNMAKVLEGNYDNRTSKQKESKGYSFDLEEYEKSHKYAVPELAEEK